jgi:hypothetical protein
VLIVTFAPVGDDTVQRALLLTLEYVTVAPGEVTGSDCVFWLAPDKIDAVVGDTAKLSSALGCAGGALTVTNELAEYAVFALDVAVIVAVPGATAVTNPLGLTDALVDADDNQVTPRSIVPVPPLVATDAESWAASPTFNVIVGGVTVMFVTAIVSSGSTGSSSLHAVRANAAAPINSSERLRMCIRLLPPEV